jgi:hypothetical protein
MKTITLIAFLISLAFASAATDFGSGPALYARAFERVDHGYYNVYGSGLKDGNGFFQEFPYSVAGVHNTSELMAPIQFTYVLDFDNYKSDVYERVDIVAADGTQLFVSENNWKPEEVLSQDGKILSYQLPGSAGSIWLRLADQTVFTDGDTVEVQFQNGSGFAFAVRNGQVTIPGWIYEQEGVFIEWKDGRKTITDIQTGLNVVGGKEIVQTRSSGIEGLVPVQISELSLNLYLSKEYNPTCEAIAQQDGQLNVWIQDHYGNIPEGVWITTVGTGMDPVYLHPAKAGFVSLRVKKGQTLHVKSRWYDGPKG